MKTKQTTFVGLVAIAIATLSSCSKSPGEGGSASISGSVNVELRDNLIFPQTAQSTFAATDENVFIIYGDNVSPDDQVETNFDGAYEFQNLRPGKYTVYVYSKNPTAEALSGSEPEEIALIQEVEIDSRGDEIILDNFLLIDETP